MRIFPNLIPPVISALGRIFSGNQYADKVIESVLKSNPKWGSRDRGFIASTVYEVVRWKRYFACLAGTDDNDPDLTKLAGVYWKLSGYVVPEDIEVPGDREIEARKKEALKIPAVRESYPDWLYQTGQQELGDLWNEEAHSLNQEARLVLRANTLKGDPGKIKQMLEEQGLELEGDPEVPEALIAKGKANVFRLPSFREGMFEVQDRSSQLVGHFLQAEPGMRVIDACAGAGGKTLHLAALMENKGRILSMDIEAWKLAEMKKRARRAGISIVEPRVIESGKTVKRLENSADRLLLDVPCSGLGVLRRNPDAKWKLSPAFLAEVRELQQSILSRYSRMLRQGGKLVYSTCSILPSENQEQVKKFLDHSEGRFTLEEERIVLPSASGFDGFYMARLALRK